MDYPVIKEQKHLPVAFLWHFHQPDYRDPSSGVFTLPWVRLHACHSYTDMLEITLANPSIAWMLNFTPVLLDQLREYTNGKASDHFLDLTLKSPMDLDLSERLFILDNFFQVNPGTQIYPSNRYSELYLRFERLAKRFSKSDLARQFSNRDIRDIQVWFNLAWMGWFAHRDERIVQLVKKGTDFSEDEKKLLIEVQSELVLSVLSKIARIPKETSSELTFTPFCHPILPLLCDTQVARQARPEMPLPKNRFRQPQEADWHIQKGIDLFQETTGFLPVGMWPSEGSVSREAVDIISKAGVKWLATDEEIIRLSLPSLKPSLDVHLPYRLSGDADGTCLFFRHRKLSDNIGFKYQALKPEEAVKDLINELERISSDRLITSDHIVTIALDGENPWGYYPDRGEQFLTQLVDKLLHHPELSMSTISSYLAGKPNVRIIDKLHSGSWISADFHIWIGDPVKNRAWDMLYTAMEYYLNIRNTLTPDINSSVEKHMHIAEGSDWFWWYGEPNHSTCEPIFDGLFKGHLAEVYRLIGAEVPDYLTH